MKNNWTWEKLKYGLEFRLVKYWKQHKKGISKKKASSRSFLQWNKVMIENENEFEWG